MISASAILPCSLVSLPIFVLARNTNPIFNSFGSIDPWVYYGFFRNLVLFKRDLFPSTYYGSRLSSILPGYAINRIFPPVAANCVLHLAIFYVALLSLYFVLAKRVNRATAWVTAIIFGVSPYLWNAVGGDYPVGTAIAYYLLTMALLTAAAERSRTPWLLALAGASTAGLIYANITWIILAPLLAAYYLFQRKMLPGERRLSQLGRLLLWATMGAAALTVVLGAINYSLDGHFWFYAPSIRFVLNNAREGRIYQAKSLTWIWGAKWLLFPALTVLGAVLAPIRIRHESPREAWTDLLFIGNFLVLAGIFVLADLFGSPMIEYHYYASMLLPAAFLAFGVMLMRVPEGWSLAKLTVFGTIVAVALSTPFWDPAGHIWEMERPLGFTALFTLTAITVIWRSLQPRSNLSLGALVLTLAGCAIATPKADQSIWATEWRTGSELQDGFLRIDQALHYIESMHDEADQRFWFDDHDRSAFEFRSLASVYLFGYSLLGHDFPQFSPDAKPRAGLLAVIPSSRSDVPELAAKSLQPTGLVPRLISKPVIERGGVKYTLYFLRLERDTATMEALTPGPGGQLMPSANSVALPLDNWQLSGSDRALVHTPTGLSISTPATQFGYAAFYRVPLSVPVDGRYLFQLHYQAINGRMMFGVLKEDRSAWLALALTPVHDGGSLLDEVTADLKAGQRIWLQTANNQPSGDDASSFIIQELRVYRLR